MDDLEADDISARPSCSTANDDCRINCTNSRSLRSILDITINQISELADSPELKNQSSEFISQFTGIFRTALQENVVVNGLPWIIDTKNISSPEKEDHEHMMDDALLSKLSRTVSSVVHKRKYVPDKCCKITRMKMRHELQNLKHAKVTDSSTSTSHIPVNNKNKDERLTKEFSEFCKTFSSIKEAVQHDLTEKQKILKKIDVASQIQTRQRTILKSIADETIAIKDC